MKKATMGKAAVAGLWFGGFQALMPVLGFLLGTQFRRQITAVDHWIAFVLLAAIGANMIKEACSDEEEIDDGSLNFKEMFMLAVATSIDALAVGITFAFLKVNIITAASIIGIITFVIAAAGVKIGNIFGDPVQIRSRACRRRNSDTFGGEDPSGAFGDFVKKKKFRKVNPFFFFFG